MIKAVIFDVDGVLLDSFESNFQYFCALMERSGHSRPTRKEMKELFHATLWDAIQAFTKLKSEKEIKKIWKLGQKKGEFGDVPMPKTPSDAPKVIRELSKRYRLGIVTSRLKEFVFEGQELEQLEKVFEVTITYHDTTKHKPHPEPLLLAAKKMNLSPFHCVYVGDTQNDVVAARAAGVKVIAYPEKLPGADAHASIFSALPKIIAKL